MFNINVVLDASDDVCIVNFLSVFLLFLYSSIWIPILDKNIERLSKSVHYRLCELFI